MHYQLETRPRISDAGSCMLTQTNPTTNPTYRQITDPLFLPRTTHLLNLHQNSSHAHPHPPKAASATSVSKTSYARISRLVSTVVHCMDANTSPWGILNSSTSPSNHQPSTAYPSPSSPSVYPTSPYNSAITPHSTLGASSTTSSTLSSASTAVNPPPPPKASAALYAFAHRLLSHSKLSLPVVLVALKFLDRYFAIMRQQNMAVPWDMVLAEGLVAVGRAPACTEVVARVLAPLPLLNGATGTHGEPPRLPDGLSLTRDVVAGAVSAAQGYASSVAAAASNEAMSRMNELGAGVNLSPPSQRPPTNTP
ncbi:hypothetical protein BC829DRAFT_442521 [Chytridium lagenaria]|nr:hypothetical protein BC829DRAFT_442521 [Chytridium lagenaria]